MNTTYSTYFQTARAVAAYQERAYRKRLRRTRQLTKRIFISLLATVIAICIGMLATGFLSRAQAVSEPIHYKYFRSVMISSGDTLSSISSRYMDGHYASIQDYMNEVCEMNHLQDADDIHAGDYLIVPYYSTDFR